MSTLTIVGGVYRERCLAPDWNRLFGSGLRAAAATADLVADATEEPVHLISWCAQSETKELDELAKSFGIAITTYSRDDAIEFQYEHGLSIPRNYPSPQKVKQVAPIEMKLDAVLRFGMLEDRSNNIRLDAKAVVYDPQAEADAVPWSGTGSRAEKLAIVANLNEAVAMSDRLGLRYSSSEHKPVAVGKALLGHEKADVVIVKNGAEGAFVITADDTHRVPCYRSTQVFPIGTGDVFSGVFAALWLGYGADPVEAAERASAATAYYTNEPMALPIPLDPDEINAEISPHRIPAASASGPRKMVYVAGPLFNFQQRWFIEEVRRCLHAHGVRTFSPFHDVGMVELDKTEQDIYRADIEGLDRCSSVFAIVDGLDAGTMVEVGYATAKGKPVIAFRQCAPTRELTMLLGCPTCKVYDDFPTAIYQAAWAALES